MPLAITRTDLSAADLRSAACRTDDSDRAGLPAHSPELNPVENVWEYLRKNKLVLRIHDRYEHIVEACCKAGTDLIADPAHLVSITVRNWANVS